jgi:3-oxoadipate enol-lactonase
VTDEIMTPPTQRIPPAPHIAVDIQGDGPLLVFLHGIGGNRTNWRAQLPSFARHFKAVAWDARGYGASDDYPGSLAFDDFVADLERVIEWFGAPHAHLVGLSMGGRIAMRFALVHPQKVATLTLVDTHEGFESFTPEKRREFVETRRAPLLSGKTAADIAPVVARSLAGPKARPEHVQQLIESISALHQESYLKSLQATVDQVTVGDISKIAAPAHFIVGADDPLTPVALHYEMAAKMGGAPVTVLPDAGHLSNIEQPEAFNRVALDWLAAHL